MLGEKIYQGQDAMRRISSVEGRRLLELARQQRAQLAGGPLGESWAVVLEALARGYLVADGADSISALIAELDSGGGLRVEDLAIEVSFDDPRGETVVLALAGEQLVASRSALVRELRRLLRAYRGEESLAPVEAAPSAAGEAAPARERAADVPRDAAEGEADEGADARAAGARVELREALSRIGGLLKERLVAAAARTDEELGRAGAAARPRVESAASSVRGRVESALATLREATARAQARATEEGGDGPAPSAAAESAPGAQPKDPESVLAELRHQLGAGPGHGDSRRKLAQAARRFGGDVEAKQGSKLAEAAERFAAWVEDESKGGAAVEGLLGKLAEALESARGQGAAAGEAGEPGVAEPPKRHLHLVRDEPAPSSAETSAATTRGAAGHDKPEGN